MRMQRGTSFLPSVARSISGLTKRTTTSRIWHRGNWIQLAGAGPTISFSSHAFLHPTTSSLGVICSLERDPILPGWGLRPASLVRFTVFVRKSSTRAVKQKCSCFNKNENNASGVFTIGSSVAVAQKGYIESDASVTFIDANVVIIDVVIKGMVFHIFLQQLNLPTSKLLRRILPTLLQSMKRE